MQKLGSLVILLILTLSCRDTTSLNTNGASADLNKNTACKVEQKPKGVLLTCPNQSPVFVANGSSCKVEQLSNGSKISCDDGSFAYVYNGKNGTNGSDGSTCSVNSISQGAEVTCSNGTSVILYNGTDGTNGQDGMDGVDGTSCSITDLANGAEITCGNSTVIIYDGTDANTSAYEVEEIHDPCGDYPGHNDEIILELEDGSFMAYLEEKGKRFLTILEDGSYRTTDKQRCNFSISGDTINW